MLWGFVNAGYELNGWVSLLSNVYIRRLDVLNRGYSGYNTEWCLRVIQHLKQELSKVKLFILFLGANDAVLPGERQHVDPVRFVENLDMLVDSVKQFCPNVLILSPPPVVVEGWAEHRRKQGRECDRTMDQTRKYSDLTVTFAKERNLPFVDLHKIFEQYLQKNNVPIESLFCDGLHFSAVGNQIVFDAVIETICREFPKLNPATLQTVFPWHDKVDVDALDESIVP